MTTNSWGGLLKQLQYVNVIDKDLTNPELIEDDITISATKSTEIKNNILQITLKNSPINYDGSNIYGKHVLPSYQLKFQEEDMFSLYLKHTNDGNDYLNSNWATTDYLIGEYMLKEMGYDTSESSTRITLKCVDRAYVIFNIVWSYSYGIGNTFTAPGLFKHTISANAQKVDNNIRAYAGTGQNAGVVYNLSAKFVSEGGYIQDYRTVAEGGVMTLLSGALNSTATTITVDSTTGFKTVGTLVISNGTYTEHIAYTGVTATEFTGCTRAIDDTSALSHLDNAEVYQGFPEVLMGKSWKPIFEWVAEISQTENTNYNDEIIEGGATFYDRAFLMWFDKNNAVHWIYADDTVDLTLDLGEEDFSAMQLQKSVFDAVNFVIYNAGEDMDGNGIMYYFYDDKSDVSSLKMRYQPMTNLANNFINNDLAINTARDTTKTQDKLRQYPASYSPAITNWSFKESSNNWRVTNGLTARTDLNNNSEYNESLREACKYAGLIEARAITSKMSGLRYNGDIALKGQHINPGDLIQVTNRYTGQNAQKLRVINVRHNINQNGWISTINVEEDEKVT